MMRSFVWSVTATLAITACGNSSEPTDAGSEAGTDVVASDVVADTAADVLDAPSDAPACTSGATFATSKELFGEGNSGQWKSFGFDIDGVTSTAASTNVCMPSSGGSASTAYPDGNNGIDNSWGKNILPILLSIDPTWVTDINNAIQSGTMSTLHELSCLPPAGDVPSLVTKVFLATPLGSVPKLDGTDTWPIAPELLSNVSDPDSSKISFANASIAGSLFDGKPSQTFALQFPFATNGNTTWMNLTLRAAHVQMTLSNDRKSATGGMIGGVIKTEELVTEVKKVGYALNLCNGSILTNIITQIRQASDILSDGTQDPQKTCDGISIGMGFEATQAQRGAVGPAQQVEQACP